MRIVYLMHNPLPPQVLRRRTVENGGLAERQVQGLPLFTTSTSVEPRAQVGAPSNFSHTPHHAVPSLFTTIYLSNEICAPCGHWPLGPSPSWRGGDSPTQPEASLRRGGPRSLPTVVPRWYLLWQYLKYLPASQTKRCPERRLFLLVK